MSLYISIHLYTSLYISIHLYISVRVSGYIYIYTPFYLSIYLPIYLSIYIYIYIYTYYIYRKKKIIILKLLISQEMSDWPVASRSGSNPCEYPNR